MPIMSDKWIKFKAEKDQLIEQMKQQYQTTQA